MVWPFLGVLTVCRSRTGPGAKRALGEFPIVFDSDARRYDGCTGASSGRHPPSAESHGLRYPVCETSNYDAVFREAAKGIIVGAQLQCEFTAPPPPEGQEYLDGYVNYTPSPGAAVERFAPVADASACGTSHFMRSGARITPCPETCGRVKENDQGTLEVLYACGARPGGLN